VSSNEVIATAKDDSEFSPCGQIQSKRAAKILSKPQASSAKKERKDTLKMEQLSGEGFKKKAGV